jgi:hypothetical protein
MQVFHTSGDTLYSLPSGIANIEEVSYFENYTCTLKSRFNAEHMETTFSKNYKNVDNSHPST